MTESPGVTTPASDGCQPTRYPFRRIGPALLGAVSAVFAIPLLAGAFLVGVGTALFPVVTGLVAGAFAAYNLSRAIGPQELRLSEEGVEIARGVATTRIPWAGVIGIAARDDRASFKTTTVGTAVISGLMVGLDLRQTVVDLTLSGAPPPEFGGLAGPLLGKARGMAGSAKPVSINLAELYPESRSTVLEVMQHCWAASRVATGA